jgi:hypothetical protein
MHPRFRLLLPALPFLLSLGCGGTTDQPAVAEPEGYPPPPVFILRDLSGTEHRPFTSPGVRAVALVFVLPDCPVANGYAPEINRLCQEYTPRGVSFFLVQVDPDLGSREAGRHAREYGYSCPVVLDSRHELVRRAGATMVPEAVVFGPDGQRKYRGRIDDQYADLGKRRAQVTSRDLRDALDAVLAGRPVRRPVTQAVGCFIPTITPKDPQP